MFSKNTVWQADKNLQYREAITYYARTAGTDTFTTVSVARARRFEIDATLAGVGDGVIPAYDLMFRVMAYFLGTTTPKVKDKLTDANGVSWQVVHVKVKHAGGVFDLYLKRIP